MVPLLFLNNLHIENKALRPFCQARSALIPCKDKCLNQSNAKKDFNIDIGIDRYEESFYILKKIIIFGVDLFFY